jgi:hypothetical protein
MDEEKTHLPLMNDPSQRKLSRRDSLLPSHTFELLSYDKVVLKDIRLGKK